LSVNKSLVGSCLGLGDRVIYFIHLDVALREALNSSVILSVNVEPCDATFDMVNISRCIIFDLLLPRKSLLCGFGAAVAYLRRQQRTYVFGYSTSNNDRPNPLDMIDLFLVNFARFQIIVAYFGDELATINRRR
jgi:hypothetical protein